MTTTDQRSEAQMLANWCSIHVTPIDKGRQIATELRRLIEENERLKLIADTDKASADHWRDECKKMYEASEADKETAKQRYDRLMESEVEPDPVERLRFFCSIAMNGRDWLDVEPFLDDINAAPQPAVPTQEQK